MITDRIGRHEVLLPIKQNYDKIERETRPQLYACIKEKQQLPWQNGRQQPAQRRSSVHFNSHHVLTALKLSFNTVQLQA